MNRRDQGGLHGGADVRRDFAGGVGSSPGGVETGAGGSMWQERRHTLKKIENILLQSKHNVDEIVVTDTNNFIGAGKGIASVNHQTGDPADN